MSWQRWACMLQVTVKVWFYGRLPALLESDGSTWAPARGVLLLLHVGCRLELWHFVSLANLLLQELVHLTWNWGVYYIWLHPYWPIVTCLAPQLSLRYWPLLSKIGLAKVLGMTMGWGGKDCLFAILVSTLFRVLRRGQVAVVDRQLANRGRQYHHALSINYKLFGRRLLFIQGGCHLAEVALLLVIWLWTDLSRTAVTIEREKFLCFLSLGWGWLLSVHEKLVVGKLHVLSGRDTWLFESLVSNWIPFLIPTVATWVRLRGVLWLIDRRVNIASVFSQSFFH